MSKFERFKTDRYDTIDHRIVSPLLPHLAPRTEFYEPCIGNGVLARFLTGHGHICVGGADIREPENAEVLSRYTFELRDARSTPENLAGSVFITNPPFNPAVIYDLIEALCAHKPTWLLVRSQWLFTERAEPIVNKYCVKVVAAGRARWVANSDTRSKESYSWCLFDPAKTADQDLVMVLLKKGLRYDQSD